MQSVDRCIPDLNQTSLAAFVGRSEEKTRKKAARFKSGLVLFISDLEMPRRSVQIWRLLSGVTSLFHVTCTFHMIHTAHDDVMAWRRFPNYRPFVKKIHRWSVDPPPIASVMRSFNVFLLLAWISSWTNNPLADLTHLSLDKMAAISQTTFSNASSWMRTFVFWFEFCKVCS